MDFMQCYFQGGASRKTPRPVGRGVSVSKNKQTTDFLVGATIGRPKSTDFLNAYPVILCKYKKISNKQPVFGGRPMVAPTFFVDTS
jgi:hypothetical protein